MDECLTVSNMPDILRIFAAAIDSLSMESRTESIGVFGLKLLLSDSHIRNSVYWINLVNVLINILVNHVQLFATPYMAFCDDIVSKECFFFMPYCLCSCLNAHLYKSAESPFQIHLTIIETP